MFKIAAMINTEKAPAISCGRREARSASDEQEFDKTAAESELRRLEQAGDG